LRKLLDDDVEWHVPGTSAIAGDYRGIEAVLAYFGKRRELARGTFRMRPREVLVGAEHIAVLTDGTVTIDGLERSWATVGLYRLHGDRIAACWLLPLDPVVFDAIWSPRTTTGEEVRRIVAGDADHEETRHQEARLGSE
jgi:hypothetical protein